MKMVNVINQFFLFYFRTTNNEMAITILYQ